MRENSVRGLKLKSRRARGAPTTRATFTRRSGLRPAAVRARRGGTGGGLGRSESTGFVRTLILMLGYSIYDRRRGICRYVCNRELYDYRSRAPRAMWRCVPMARVSDPDFVVSEAVAGSSPFAVARAAK